MEQVVEEVFRKYNITPHSTLKYKSPNQVHYNIPSSSRQYLYSSVDEVTKEVSEEAQKGHEKFLKVLQKQKDLQQSKVAESWTVCNGACPKMCSKSFASNEKLPWFSYR